MNNLVETINRFTSDISSTGICSKEVESKLLAGLYLQAAKDAVAADELFIAEKLAGLGLAHAETAKRPTVPFYQMKALALARSGSTRQAYQLLLRLSSVTNDPESAGLLARAFRDIGWSETNPIKRRQYFKEAKIYALDSLERSLKQTKGKPNYYNAIQVAQFAFFSDDPEAAVRFADQADSECNQEERQELDDPKKTFWRAITHAEAALIRGDNLEHTIELYRIANRLGAKYSSDLSACWRVARELADHHKQPKWEVLKDLLVGPDVILFTGHQFDINTKANRFSIERAKEVKAKMYHYLEKSNPQRVFCSHSFGSDQLFLEAANELNIPITLVLAFSEVESKQSYASGVNKCQCDQSNWLTRMDILFESVSSKSVNQTLSNQSHIHEIDFPLPNEVEVDLSIAYEHTNKVMAGMAFLEASKSNSPLRLAIVNDSSNLSGRVGGTANFLTQIDTRLADITNFIE